MNCIVPAPFTAPPVKRGARLPRVVLASVLALSATACGQKGPLTLAAPGADAPQASTAPHPAAGTAAGAAGAPGETAATAAPAVPAASAAPAAAASLPAGSR